MGPDMVLWVVAEAKKRHFIDDKTRKISRMKGFLAIY